MSNNILTDDESDDGSQKSEQEPIDLEAAAYAAVLRKLLGLSAIKNQSPSDLFLPLLNAIEEISDGRPELADLKSLALDLRKYRFRPRLDQIQDAQRLLLDCRTRAEQLDLASTTFERCKGASVEELEDLTVQAKNALRSTDAKLKFFELVHDNADPSALQVLETLSSSPEFWADDRSKFFQAFLAAVAKAQSDDESEYDSLSDGYDSGSEYNSGPETVSNGSNVIVLDDDDEDDEDEDEDSDDEDLVDDNRVVKATSEASSLDDDLDQQQSVAHTKDLEPFDPEDFRRRLEKIVVANLPDTINVTPDDAAMIARLLWTHDEFMNRIVDGRCRFEKGLEPITKAVVHDILSAPDSAVKAMQLLSKLYDAFDGFAEAATVAMFSSPANSVEKDVQIDVDQSPEFVDWLRQHVDSQTLQSQSHAALSRSLAQTPPELKRLRLLVALGADVDAFQNAGISTKGDQRSFVHQIAEKQASLVGVTPSSDGSVPPEEQIEQATKLIQQLIDRGADLLQWADVENSESVASMCGHCESNTSPALFYGFEAIRTPYVTATRKASPKAKDDAIRVRDMWPLVKILTGSEREALLGYVGKGDAAVAQFLNERPSSSAEDDALFKAIVAHLESADQQQPQSNAEPNRPTKASRASQFLGFLCRNRDKLQFDAELAKSEGMSEGERMSTCICKLGIDWTAESGGKIAALLDGVDFAEVLNYGDRKQLHRFGDGVASFSKVITYSEIRHMLRNWDRFKDTVEFYRRGKKLSSDAVEQMKQSFDRRRDTTKANKERARQVLSTIETVTSLDVIYDLLNEHADSLERCGIDVNAYLNRIKHLIAGRQDEGLALPPSGRNRRLEAHLKRLVLGADVKN